MLSYYCCAKFYMCAFVLGLKIANELPKREFIEIQKILDCSRNLHGHIPRKYGRCHQHAAMQYKLDYTIDIDMM